MRALRTLHLAGPTAVGLLIGITVVVTVAAIGTTGKRQPRVLPGALDCRAVTGTTQGSLDAAQERNAKFIVAVALSRKLGNAGGAIGVTVALAEATLYNYANDGTSTLIGSAEGRQLNSAERAVARESLRYPHDRVGNNLDSIGLFQQRPMTGWGSPDQLIDPTTSAGLFYDRLTEVPGWQALPPWNAAQTVQGSPSSDGGIYREMYERAVTIVDELTADTTTVDSPAAVRAIPRARSGDQWCLGAAGAAAPERGGSAEWGGYSNGKIPASALCPVPTAPRLLLECHAAAAFDHMNSAFRAAIGQDIGITDGYRDYAGQVACQAEKGNLCAVPGTSNHGWAKAVDIGACCGVNSGTGPAFDWLTANAGRFGWVHPAWARPGGSKPEPWHWEYGAIS
jgi:hypothetical protein